MAGNRHLAAWEAAVTEAQAEEMLALLRQIARQTAPPAPVIPPGANAHLHALARVDRDAAIAEARRLSAAAGRQRRARR